MRCLWPALLAGLLSALLVAPVHAAPAPVESYSYPLDLTTAVYSPGAGAPGQDLVLDGAGYAHVYVTTLRPTTRVLLLLEAESCDGAPQVRIAVDGQGRLDRRVYGNGQYALVGSWPAGRHRLGVRLLTGHETDRCRRSITVYGARLQGRSDGSPAVVSTWQTPHLDDATQLPAGASPRERWAFHLTGSAILRVRQDTQGARELDVWAETDPCTGTRPTLELRLDGVLLYADQVPQRGPVEGPGPFPTFLELPGRFADGRHDIEAAVRTEDVSGDCTTTVDLGSFEFRGWA